MNIASPALAALCAVLLAGSGAAAPAAPKKTAYGSAITRPPAAQLSRLGRALFFDASLSASGTQSCASCHDPRHAYGPPNGLSAQLGGKDMRRMGSRAAPSLRYIQTLPAFTEHFFDNDGDDSKDQGPTGGHDWDGRAGSAHEQAAGPLLSPAEMGNRDRHAVVEKLRRASYAGTFRTMFGNTIFDRPDDAFDAATMALEVFQQDPQEFYPYSSRYDGYLRGQAKLNTQELRGLALFSNPAKGNCAACHPSGMTSSGFPQFTDYGFIALGAPRNAALTANASSRYYDMGLCGPQRTDFAAKTEYCGMFRTPSLRNAGLRTSFFHNGVFHSLREVLQFYAQRDSNPGKWYPRHADGAAQRFDDLPRAYHPNVYRDAPFSRQAPGKAALSPAEIEDMITFLHTLTDAR